METPTFYLFCSNKSSPILYTGHKNEGDIQNYLLEQIKEENKRRDEHKKALMQVS